MSFVQRNVKPVRKDTFKKGKRYEKKKEKGLKDRNNNYV